MYVPVAGRTNPQLAEFLADISTCADGESALAGAVEWSSEAFEAEVVAALRGREVVTSLGYARGQVRTADLVAAADGSVEEIDVPGAGPCAVTTVALQETADAHFVLARRAADPFSVEEINLLRSVVRILDLTLRMFNLLDQARAQARENESLVGSLSERQALLERLSRIQRSISHRAPLQEVLDAIVAGASDLVGDETASLSLLDSDNPSWLVMASSAGPDPEPLGISRRMRLEEGVRGRAVLERRLIVAERCNQPTREADPQLDLEAGLTAAMAAPVHEKGHIVGCLSVGSLRPGRTYSATEQEMLLAFAEHVSLALTDARTVEAMHEALHDALTGLANRALFLDRLENALQRSRRAGTQLSVLFIDLDRFKMVNDSRGHAAGDQILVAVARRLQATLRLVDTAARLGGDEFVVLIEDHTGPGSVRAVAEGIYEALRKPFMVGTREMFVSASIGIAHAGPETQDAEELLLQADLAMYRAKSRSAHHVAVFEEAMRIALTERMELEGDLQRALDRGELTIRYQPVVELDTGHIAGVEALVRWHHPERGTLTPAAFLDLAEETGLIVPMGWWTIREALRQASRWSARASGPPPFVSVNLGAVQLAQSDVAQRVGDALDESGVDPSRLMLEITETVLMRETDAIVDHLWQLKDLGTRLAIDDFGIGYSSLAYLSGFPIDILKIPKTFVDRLGRGREESSITRAIVSLSQTLRLDAVAEGMEEPVQLEVLRGLGCRFGQGFLFAQPLTAIELDSLIASSKGLPPAWADQAYLRSRAPRRRPARIVPIDGAG